MTTADFRVLRWVRVALMVVLTQVVAYRGLAQAQTSAQPPAFQTYLPDLQRLYQARDWTTLEQRSRQAMSTMEEHFGPGAAPVGAAAAWLAMSLNAQGRFPEAESAARRSLAINEQVLGADNANTTGSMLLLAMVLQSELRVAEAEPLVERALASREKTLGDEHPDTSEALTDLALLRQHLGNYEGAEALYRRSLAINEHRFGSDGAELISVLLDLARLSQLEGRYAAGEALARRAHAIADKTRGPEHPTTADTADVLASLLQSQGRYAEAEALFRRSLATYEKTYGAENAVVASGLNRLGAMFLTQGRLAEAEPLFRRSLAMREKLLGPESPKTAVYVNNLAVLMTSERRYAEAEAFDRRVLAIDEKALGPEDVLTAGSLNNLATSLRFQGRFDEAEALQRRALEILEKKLGPDSPDTLLQLNNLGNLLYYAGRNAQAEPVLRRALASADKTLGAEHPTTTAVHANLALNDVALGKFEDAARNDRAGCAGRARANVSADSSGIAARANRTYANDCWLRLSLSLSSWAAQGGGPTPADRPESLQQEAFLTSQRAVQSAAGDALGKSAALALATAAGVGTEAQSYESALLERDALDQRYATQTGVSGADNIIKAEALSQAHTELVARIDGLTAQLKAKAPAFWDFRAPEPISVASLQAGSGPDAVLLTPQEALVTFLVAPGKDKGLVFVVTKDQAAWARIGASGAEISARVNALRRQIDPEAYGLSPGNSTRAGRFDRQAAYELYQTLLGDPSIQSAIRDKPVLLFVPSGPLTSLPPALLVTAPPAAAPGGPDPQTLRATPWLIRSKAVAFLPAVNSLRTLRQLQPSRRRVATEPLLAFADPDFSRHPTAAKQSVGKPSARGFNSYFRDGVPLADALETLPPLPGTRIEGEALVKALAARPGSLLTGQEASKAELMTRNQDGRLAAVRVLEFATHGLVAGDATDLSEPALALAAGGTPADELLLASEAAGLKLNADWVLLSACNTASPDAAEAQGLSGLSRAFFYAGAKSLLVSHWRVRDDVAPALIPAMLLALREHPTMSRAQALRQSTLAILDDPNLDAADPAAWAPFTLVGEAGP